MCGIVGAVNFTGRLPFNKDTIEEMCNSLTHRGPDESGYHYEDNVAFAHRRLSIIDLSGGKQPMRSSDNNYTITYNGEIYNFNEIKSELQDKGYKFDTHSDTEVLLKAFIEYGTACFNMFNGMFAVGIWDTNKQQLTLARDKTGKKPLYYCHKGNTIVFASELKAIYLSKLSNKQIDDHAIQDYLTFGYIPTPKTIFNDIKKLPPATFATVSDANFEQQSYWDIHYSPTSESYNTCKNKAKDLLYKSVERRLVSDVPFGAFLSGGIDSSIVVSMMQEIMDIPVKTFSIGFDVDKYSELNDARLISDKLGTSHTEFVINRNCTDIFDEFIDYYDEPFADSSSLPTYYVSKLASDHVKMVLTGDGGDECFGGYKRYSRHLLNKRISQIIPDTQLCYTLLSMIPSIGNKITSVAKRANSEFPFNYLKEVALCSTQTIRKLTSTDPNYDSYEELKDLFSSQSTQLESIYYGDIKSYMLDDILVKVDRMSMANSIELRSPFLDPDLLEYSATIPDRYKTNYKHGKLILRDISKDYVPSRISSGKKRGFAIPLQEWFKHDLKIMLLDLINSTSKSGIFDYDLVLKLISEHDNNLHDHSELLWQILCFERWSLKYK